MDVFDKVEAKYGVLGIVAFAASTAITFFLGVMMWIAMLMEYPSIGVAIPPMIAAYLAWSAYKNDEAD